MFKQLEQSPKLVLPEAIMLVSDALPGMALMQATQGTPTWPEGWYGLVQVNEQILAFPGPLVPNLTAGLSDAEISALPQLELAAARASFGDSVNRVAEQRNALADMRGYHLLSASLAAGYDARKDGTNLASWLTHHLASKLAVK